MVGCWALRGFVSKDRIAGGGCPHVICFLAKGCYEHDGSGTSYDKDSQFY
jgi:hypothetical protein